MVLIGDFADNHTGLPAKDESQSAADLGYLINSVGVDIQLFGGDQCQGSGGLPHTPESQIRTFFQDVYQPAGGDSVETHFVHGNHESPRDWWQNIASEYVAESSLLLPKKIEPVDGVVILMVETMETTAKGGGRGGVSNNRCYMPRYQIAWLREQLQQHAGDIKIVYGHAPVLPCTNSDKFTHTREAELLDGTTSNDFRPDSGMNIKSDVIYEMISNPLDLYLHTQDVGPYVYVSHHDSTQGESVQTVPVNDSGNTYIYHIYQEHYAFGQGPDNPPHKTGYLDADPLTGNLKYISVEPTIDGSTKNTLMDITPSW